MRVLDRTVELYDQFELGHRLSEPTVRAEHRRDVVPGDSFLARSPTSCWMGRAWW